MERTAYAYDESKMLSGIADWRRERALATRRQAPAAPAPKPKARFHLPSRYIPAEDRQPVERFEALHPIARKVCEVVCEEFCLTVRELTTPTNRWEISKVRHVAFYLLVRVMGLSMPRAGALLGGYHHTTVLNGIRVTEKRMRDNAEYCSVIRGLVEQLGGKA